MTIMLGIKYENYRLKAWITIRRGKRGGQTISNIMCWTTPPRNKIHITEIDIKEVICPNLSVSYAHTYSYTKM